MKYLKVRNWERWQSYRSDRGQPPWIKLYRALLLDANFVSLTDGEKGQLVCIFLLAAERNGLVPDDADMIRMLCRLEKAPDLRRFISAQFLESQGKRRRPRLKNGGATDQRQNTEADQNPSPIVPSPSDSSGRGAQNESSKRMVRPALDDVRAYCAERGNHVDPEAWMDHYSANGWKVGRNPMKDWKAAVRTWERNGRGNGKAGNGRWETPHERLSRLNRIDPGDDLLAGNGRGDTIEGSATLVDPDG